MSKNKKAQKLEDLKEMQDLPNASYVIEERFFLCPEYQKDAKRFQLFVEITKNHPCTRCFTKGCKLRQGRMQK